MSKRIVRLTESELIHLVKRVVKEEAMMPKMGDGEMEEGFLGDLGRGVRNFATGHRSSEERDERMQNLMDDFEAITDMVEENPDSFMYGNKWDKVSNIYKEKMEDNNYRGFFTINGLELDDPKLQDLVQRMLKDETRQMVVKYNDVLTTAQKMGSGASSAVRGGMSKAVSNESLRRRNRLR